MNRKAFPIIWVIVLLVIVGAGIYFFSSLPGRQTIDKEKLGNSDCQSNPSPVFSVDITDLSKIIHIVPPVTVQKTGVKTHSYIFTGARVPVYAPADSVFYEGAFYEEEGMGQYSLFFRASCEVVYMLDHIKEPIGSIKANFSTTPAGDSRTKRVESPISFKAGDLIGYTTGTSNGVWDFGAYNTAKQNPYSGLDLAHKEDLRFAHAVCPFDYFPQDKRQLYSNLLRNADGSTLTNPQSLCFQ